jgi:hypothetical protein
MKTSAKPPKKTPAPPLDLTIQNVQLTGFGTVDPQPAGAPPIRHYNGIPFYCHVSDAGGGMFSLVVNRHGPSTFQPVANAGPIQLVTVAFGATNGPGAQTMSFAPSGVTYDGSAIDAWLKINAPGNATLVLRKRPGSGSANKTSAAKAHKTNADTSGDEPTIVTITVAASENGTSNDLVFFTDIPLPSATVRNGDQWSATITWADNPGGAMGPIGNANTP